MVVVIDKDGNKKEYELLKDCVTDLFGEFNDSYRRGLTRTYGTDKLYKGYRVIERGDVKPKELEGKSEIKPKFDRINDTFIIHCKNRKSITVDLEFMREFMIRYCVDKLTLNQMALTMNKLREDIIVIKTAFGITKDSAPFMQEDIDNMTSDEMAEEIRRLKKLSFQNKLHEKKFVDIEKEVKKLHNKEWILQEVIKELKDVKPLKIEPKVMKYVSHPNSKKILTVPIADLHIGMIVKNVFNEYNFEIAKKRMVQLSRDVIAQMNEHSYSEIIIEGIGDYVHGTIHDSIHKESEFPVTIQVKKVVELVSFLIQELYTSLPQKITIGIIGGNHDRLNKEKNANSQDDSWHIVIREWLRTMFLNSQVNFVDEVCHNLLMFNMFDGKYCILAHHGHEGRTLQRTITSMINRGIPILEIHQGHFHHKGENEEGYILKITYPSFCGVDMYAETKLYSGDAYVELRTYDIRGFVSAKKVRFNS